MIMGRKKQVDDDEIIGTLNIPLTPAFDRMIKKYEREPLMCVSFVVDKKSQEARHHVADHDPFEVLESLVEVFDMDDLTPEERLLKMKGIMMRWGYME